MNRERISYETFIINALLFYKNPISMSESTMIRNTINNSHLPFIIDEEDSKNNPNYEFVGLNYFLKDESKVRDKAHNKLSKLFKKISSYEEEKITLKKANQTD